MPSSVARNEKSLRVGAVFLKNMMLPAGFVA